MMDTDAYFQRLKQEMQAASDQMHRDLEEGCFNPPTEQLAARARVSRPTFGDILNPTPDPLYGLRAMLAGER